MSSVTTNEVTWSSLPNKDQLFVLVVARFSEPVIRTSILTYIFYQLQSIDPSKSANEVIREAAILQTVFTLMQGITALFWGYVADSPRGGRKLVLLVGLSGSLVISTAFGFIQNFGQAVLLRLLEGALNGNTAIIRTMVSEVVEERRFQSKAFILMPMSYNLACIVSPMMAGLLANLPESYPQHFSENHFLRRFPYAPPAIASGCVVFLALILVFFCLRETQATARHRYDLGLDLASRLTSLFSHNGKNHHNQRYKIIPPPDLDEEMAELVNDRDEGKADDFRKGATKPTLPLRRMFTRNLCLCVISYAIQEGHVISYNTLWPSFLSDPVALPGKNGIDLPFHFSGGLGMPVKQVAISLAMVGVLGIPLQILGYSTVVKRLGLLRTWRIFLVGLPLAYFLIPYISIVPSSTAPPAARDGPLVWLIIFFSQALVIGCTTFVIPSQIMLTNNSSPHPSALGRTHSITVMLASFSRTVSPVLAGLVYSYWSVHGITGMAWWMMSVAAVVGCISSLFVYEGNGHEIWMEGDNEE